MDHADAESTDDGLSGFDRVIEFYKQRVDMEQLRRNLALTVEERLIQLQRRVQAFEAEQRTKSAPSPQ